MIMNRMFFLPCGLSLAAKVRLVRLAPNILYSGDESGQANSTFVQIIFDKAKPL